MWTDELHNFLYVLHLCDSQKQKSYPAYVSRSIVSEFTPVIAAFAFIAYDNSFFTGWSSSENSLDPFILEIDFAWR